MSVPGARGGGGGARGGGGRGAGGGGTAAAEAEAITAGRSARLTTAGGVDVGAALAAATLPPGVDPGTFPPESMSQNAAGSVGPGGGRGAGLLMESAVSGTGTSTGDGMEFCWYEILGE